MVRYISRLFISNLLDQIDIVSLIKNKINLKKKGKNFFGICPFHLEKNPSFVVSSSKQLYHCFGCGIHGNIIDFIMKYDNLSFLESIESIANLFNIPIIYNNKSNFSQKIFQKNRIYYKLIANLSFFYKNSLLTPLAKEAYQYLLNRGLNPYIIEYFSIGFSPLFWQKKILNNKKIIKILYKKLGILKKNTKNNNFYDIFYNRIIFPIKNINGIIIGFGGRVFKNINPKYLNSAENHIFHKSQELYGLYETKKENNIIKKILIVEGYIDVISLFQFNIKYAVAILGSSITNIHIKKLFSITNKIIYCFDGDETGIKAQWKSLKISLPYLVNGKKIKFMILPNGEDPDSLIRKEGQILFKKRIKNTLSFSKFFFKQLFLNNVFSSCEQKTNFIYKALSFIKIIPDYLFQINLIKKLGEKIGIINLVDIYHSFKVKKKIIINNNFKKTTIRILLSLLIQNPKLIKFVPQLKFFKSSNINGLFFLIKFVNFYKNKNITTVNILEQFRGTKLKKIFEILVTWNHMIPDHKIEQFFINLIKKLKINILENRIDYLISLDRKKGLDHKKKKELWSLNQKLIKKKIILKI
ncbi:DNA primase [Enterobacteriaceae endosymbiont of Donacia bicoloricornis]|uniref:DNA primase n=1 Tax=Enterobacteriaceae endosymbiont of Donacia bicoloricornis TaxID=2675772 RepID=UPI001448F6D9|nr:DNA primase [Enterobacteriaceae endosymbiont of Donacia bicoloricornis]QJC37757.1 DNA primase [Enterobacteriaceae endosymbiont of Donacia bicoloricornis]